MIKTRSEHYITDACPLFFTVKIVKEKERTEVLSVCCLSMLSAQQVPVHHTIIQSFHKPYFHADRACSQRHSRALYIPIAASSKFNVSLPPSQRRRSGRHVPCAITNRWNRDISSSNEWINVIRDLTCVPYKHPTSYSSSSRAETNRPYWSVYHHSSMFIQNNLLFC